MPLVHAAIRGANCATTSRMSTMHARQRNQTQPRTSLLALNEQLRHAGVAHELRAHRSEIPGAARARCTTLLRHRPYLNSKVIWKSPNNTENNCMDVVRVILDNTRLRAQRLVSSAPPEGTVAHHTWNQESNSFTTSSRTVVTNAATLGTLHCVPSMEHR